MENAEIMDGRQQQVPGLEPSGVRLMAFLTTYQAEVLDREKNNEQFIHLYGTGGYWVAFERSACQLCQLFSRSETSIFNFATYPFPVVMASITDGDLRVYARKHIPQTVGPDYKVLTVPVLAPELYKQWYSKEIREFL